MLDVLGVEARLLVEVVRRATPDVPVPGASGLTVRESVRHLGDVCEDTLSWLGTPESSARAWGLPPEASLAAARDRCTARLADLLAEFGTRPATQRCPSWWPEDQTVGFWLRRMVHATTLHRLDIQSAIGVPPTPVAEDIALDGIDEILRAWFGHRLNALGIRPARVCSVRVEAAARRWWVETGTSHGVVTEPRGAEASAEEAVVAGDPQSVLLWLWGRLPDRAIRTAGDLDAIAQLWGLLRLATQ
jgi:hypothetical protein